MSLRRTVSSIFVALFLGAILVGCGPTDADFNRVEINMTKDEVRAIMGEPDSSTEVFGAAEQWTYRDKYFIQFALGKVVIKEKE